MVVRESNTEMVDLESSVFKYKHVGIVLKR